MDITDTTQRRFEVGIELFVEGQPVAYNSVLFSKDGERALHIHCHSDWDIENTTAYMAKAKIARAKEVLAELESKGQAFKRTSAGLPHRYYFCYDYGMGSVALAQEVNNALTWLSPSTSQG
jgi:cytosine/adenosine deaminase-related metal-dependent hydrolase